MKLQHGAHVLGHGALGRLLHALGIGPAPVLPVAERPALGQIAVDGIVRRGLVGHHVGPHAAPHQLGKDLGRVAEQADRQRLLLPARLLDHGQRLVERLGLRVEIARLQPHLDAARLALDRQHRGARHHGRQRLRAAHAAEARGENPLAGEAAAVVAPPHLHERLVGALHDALAADVDPRAGRHLAVHHQALAIELVEVRQRRPVRHDVGVGDQHARRVGVRAEHADRLARLHQQRLVAVELAQGCDDAVEALPVARGAADAAVDDELARLLGHFGIEVVHEHAQRRFGQPALGGDAPCRGGADAAGIVDAGHAGLELPSSAKRRQVSRIARSVPRDVGGVGRIERHRPVALVDRADGLAHVAAAGQLHLHGMHAAAPACRSGA